MVASPRPCPPPCVSLSPLLALLAGCAGATPPPPVTPRVAPRPILPPPPWQSRPSVAEGYEPRARAAASGDDPGRDADARHRPHHRRGGPSSSTTGRSRRSPRATFPAPAGAVVDRRHRQVRDARAHRHPLAPRRLPDARRLGPRGRQRDDRAVTPHAQAVDAFWPQDPGIERAVAGGVTAIQVLPGSGNLIGGRAVTRQAATRPSRRARCTSAGAPDGLKMACGENPKRVYGGEQAHADDPHGQPGPAARGVPQGAEARARVGAGGATRGRDAVEAAAEEAGRATRPSATSARSATAWCRRPRRARSLRRVAASSGRTSRSRSRQPTDPVAAARPRSGRWRRWSPPCEGRVLVQVHCYRADDMLAMIALSDEVGFQIRTFHHALEAYKIRDELARRGIGVSTWADWWGFKIEAFDGIPENAALVHEAGGRRDHPLRLGRRASSASTRRRPRPWRAAGRAGVALTDEDALRWITAEPGLGARRRRSDGLARGRQGRRRRALGQEPVLGLRLGREGLDRRRAPSTTAASPPLERLRGGPGPVDAPASSAPAHRRCPVRRASIRCCAALTLLGLRSRAPRTAQPKAPKPAQQARRRPAPVRPASRRRRCSRSSAATRPHRHRRGARGRHRGARAGPTMQAGRQGARGAGRRAGDRGEGAWSSRRASSTRSRSIGLIEVDLEESTHDDHQSGSKATRSAPASARPTATTRRRAVIGDRALRGADLGRRRPRAAASSPASRPGSTSTAPPPRRRSPRRRSRCTCTSSAERRARTAAGARPPSCACARRSTTRAPSPRTAARGSATRAVRSRRAASISRRSRARSTASCPSCSTSIAPPTSSAALGRRAGVQAASGDRGRRRGVEGRAGARRGEGARHRLSRCRRRSRSTSLGARDDNAALLHGGRRRRSALSTGETHNARKLRQVAGNAVRAGLAARGGASRRSRARPPRRSGMGARYGTLAPGKVANLVVWSGDPLEIRDPGGRGGDSGAEGLAPEPADFAAEEVPAAPASLKAAEDAPGDVVARREPTRGADR